MTLSSNLQFSAAPSSEAVSLNGLTIRQAQVEDAEAVAQFLRFFQEVSFCEWQDRQQLELLILSQQGCCYIAMDPHSRLVGAAIGGIMGTRGTVNHLAISPRYRQMKIGTTLTQSLLQHFRERGVKRVFLFIDDRNQLALNFWHRQGFAPTQGETTCEIDL
ncbi:GNAT family N-acetyltransferase [Candidatus Pantoea multigeneris]|uniref:GNAT family N-acetyltransferase n=1 Tax=Candidatus Pantoea multigeneris TaxID=2608357 RepID=A0ABX0RCW4_9GAMM|nr:N-acetyltransferase [Pantoea multigeneris]NIF22408.1 GNAT family N-acetyltransferase [Pantoea multigeneris]